MHCEGASLGLHHDKAPEEGVPEITDLNWQMMVKDSWAEPGCHNQNPVEAMGANPLKKGIEVIMNMTGADDGAWPWAGCHICDIHNCCAAPALNCKTQISV